MADTEVSRMVITILNVHEIHPRHLAVWVDANLLDQRLPGVSPNTTVDPRSEIVPMLSTVANKLVLATELYNVIVGHLVDAKVWSKTVSKSMPKGNDYEQYKDRLEASKEVLYRTIQTLSYQYEAASRLMTGLTVADRLINSRYS